MRRTMAQVRIQRLVVGHSVIHVALDHRVRRRRPCVLDRIARQPLLRIPRHPIRPRAVRRLRRPHLPRLRPHKARRRVHIQRPHNPQRVRAHIIRAQHPRPPLAAAPRPASTARYKDSAAHPDNPAACSSGKTGCSTPPAPAADTGSACGATAPAGNAGSGTSLTLVGNPGCPGAAV